jgi:DNA-binding transcriptional LysR family regulator
MHAALLRYIETVARLGSIRKAATVLNVASSAVNRQILKLEDEIGTPLFQRIPGGLRPTPVGELVIRHARDTLHEFDSLKSEIAALKGLKVGLVKIATLDSLMVDLLPREIAAFHKVYPAISFEMTTGGPGEIGAKVASGDIDIGFSFNTETPAEVLVAAEVPAPLGAIMLPSHPLAKRPSVTLADCVRHPFILQHDTRPIRSYVEEIALSAKSAGSPVLVSNTVFAIKPMILAGVGLAFYTPLAFLREIERGEVVFVPLAHARLTALKLVLIVHRHHRPAIASAVMIEHLRAAMERLAQTVNREAVPS